jgi:hypothetical protein
LNQSKIPEALREVMNEMVFASGMETTALMNDSNTETRCSKTIQRRIFVDPAIATIWESNLLSSPYLIN